MNIHVPVHTNKKMYCSILNPIGKILIQKELLQEGQSIDISNLSQGHYILNISLDGYKQNLRFIKQ